MRLLRITKAFVLAALLSVFVFSSTQIYANANFELCVEITGGCKNNGCTAAGYSCSREAQSKVSKIDDCDCTEVTTGRAVP